LKRLNSQTLLLLWFILGLGLRLIHLTTLPPWTDECATIAFSLGNSFLDVPLDRAISTEILMQPLQLRPEATVADVVDRLMAESTHPPLYFIFAHYWMQVFGEGNVLWAARSFSALFGAFAIPASYFLSLRAFASPVAAHLAAVLMAVSPFGVFLSQEARHYTLAVFVSIASLYCFVVAVEAVRNRKPLAAKWSIAWILVNGFGIAVHYFFGLVPLSEAWALGGIWLARKSHRNSVGWRGVVVAALGTAISGFAWIPVWQRVAGSNLTDWVYDGGISVDSLVRSIAWIISMLVTFPVDLFALSLWLVIVNAFLLLASCIWLVQLLWKSSLPSFPSQHLPITLSPFLLYLLSSIVLLLGITYGFGSDLTLAPRFFFPVFPAVVVLAAARIAPRWNSRRWQVFVVCSLASIGSLSVLGNVSYLQNHRGDRLARFIAQTSRDVPVLIATTHKHHGQTGRLMSIAWEFEKIGFSQPVRFLLARKGETDNPTETLNRSIVQLPKPFDVWLVNFHAEEMSDDLQCEEFDDDEFPEINGYRYNGYRCDTSF